MAALRHEQLLAAGNVTVAGLSGDTTDGQKQKRPIYGNKRKGKKDQEKSAPVAAEETPAKVEETVPEPPKPKVEKTKANC